jgi:hypothetical protein
MLTALSTRSRTIDSMSRPTYPTSVNLDGSARTWQGCTKSVRSLGVDAAGELYVISGNSILKITQRS